MGLKRLQNLSPTRSEPELSEALDQSRASHDGRSSSVELDDLPHHGLLGSRRVQHSIQPSPRPSSVFSDHSPRVKDANEKSEAQQANDAEVSMTLREGLRQHPTAIVWSMVISTCIIMEGYDVSLLANFYGYPSFQRQFGVPVGGGYQVPAHWASIINFATTVSTLLGLAINGWATEKYGYRPVVLSSLAAIAAFIFVPFLAQSMPVLLVGEILCSIPWGVFQTLTTAYASEVCPVVLRCYLTTYVNLCWVIGQFIAAGILRALVTRVDEWGFRIPFALQWIWPVPLFVAVLFAPESPWWLIRQGRIGEAEHSVRRLASNQVDTKSIIEMMKYTNDLEREQAKNENSTSYAECFSGTNLRRTEIASMVWVTQNACGGSFVSWGSYFFQVAGLNASQAYSLSLGSLGIAFVGTVASWILLTYFGRRTLYLSGLIVMFCIFSTVGLFSLAPASDTGIVWATASLFYLFHLVYGLTIGPVCYTVVSEIPSTRLRSKTVIIARGSYVVVGLFTNAITPLMVQETGWDWKYRTGFFWAGSCALLLLWCFFRLPEPKGKSYGEMAVLFAKGTPAREFATTVVKPFEAETIDDVVMQHL